MIRLESVLSLFTPVTNWRVAVFSFFELLTSSWQRYTVLAAKTCSRLTWWANCTKILWTTLALLTEKLASCLCILCRSSLMSWWSNIVLQFNEDSVNLSCVLSLWDIQCWHLSMKMLTSVNYISFVTNCRWAIRPWKTTRLTATNGCGIRLFAVRQECAETTFPASTAPVDTSQNWTGATRRCFATMRNSQPLCQSCCIPWKPSPTAQSRRGTGFLRKRSPHSNASAITNSIEVYLTTSYCYSE